MLHNSDSLSYTITFSQAVNGVTADDFEWTKTGTANGTIGTPTTSDNGLTWTVPITSVSGDGTPRLDLKATGAGIASTTTPAVAITGGFTGGQIFTVDNTAPTTTFSTLALSADTGSSSTDFNTKTASQTLTATLNAALAEGDKLFGSLDGGTTWIDITNKVDGTGLLWNGITLDSTGSLKLKVTDAAGNDSTVHTQNYVLDTSEPTALSLASSSLNTSAASSGATVSTFSTTDTPANGTFSYELVEGDSSTDNGKFTIDGGSLKIGTTALTAGSYQIRVKVTDLAGNSYETR